MSPNFEAFLASLERWCRATETLVAAGIVGSHARGAAREDSDIDVILLCRHPTDLLNDRTWLSRFGDPASVSHERWGAMTALRVFYDDGQEVEFGISAVSWARLPPDPGTRRVVAGGLRIVYDPEGRLGDLQRGMT